MNLRAFLVDALGQALELGIGTPDDVVRHVTPDVLAQYLPRPLWARLLTACLGAPRVDATLIVETIGVPNLCEHVPTAIVWAVITDVAQRALGRTAAEILSPHGDVVVARGELRGDAVPASARASASGSVATGSRSVPLAPPPPEVVTPAPAPAPPVAVGPSIPPVNAPLADLIDELAQDDPPAPRTRPPTSQRFRPAQTGLGRLGAASQGRRPQAAASPTPSAIGSRPRRIATEVNEPEMQSEAPTSNGEAVAVDDSQLVDWSSNDETEAGGEDFTDFRRKR